MGRSRNENVDPLAQIIAPPAGETPEQRWTREHREGDAKKISEQIDEALRTEREERKAKRKNKLKVLLLGQSESGTSISSERSVVMIPCGHFCLFSLSSVRFDSLRFARISNPGCDFPRFHPSRSFKKPGLEGEDLSPPLVTAFRGRIRGV